MLNDHKAAEDIMLAIYSLNLAVPNYPINTGHVAEWLAAKSKFYSALPEGTTLEPYVKRLSQEGLIVIDKQIPGRLVTFYQIHLSDKGKEIVKSLRDKPKPTT